MSTLHHTAMSHENACARSRSCVRRSRPPGATASRSGWCRRWARCTTGHLSLIARARERCDFVVVSLFVNPAQFDERADLERYPRDEADDAELAGGGRRRPAVRPPRPRRSTPTGFATHRRGAAASASAWRASARGAEHFRGVATVVTKLLCMVAPDVAYFGQKDAQQVLVIRRLVGDLEPAGADRGAARPCARPTGWRCPAATRCSARRASATARWRSSARCAAGEASRPRASARAARARGGAHASSPPRASSPSTSSSSTPTRSSRSTSSTATALLVLAARVGEVRLIDNDAPRAGGRGQSRPAPRPATPGRRRRSMQRVMLKSKIHRATVTDCDLHYVGSITIDPRPARGRRHPRARAGPRRRCRQRRALRDLHDRRGARLGRDARQRRRRPARSPRRHDHRHLLRLTTTEAELERYEPRVVHVEAQTNRIITDRRRGGDPARLSRTGVNRRQRGITHVQPTPPSRPRPTPAACR